MTTEVHKYELYSHHKRVISPESMSVRQDRNVMEPVITSIPLHTFGAPDSNLRVYHSEEANLSANVLFNVNFPGICAESGTFTVILQLPRQPAIPCQC